MLGIDEHTIDRLILGPGIEVWFIVALPGGMKGVGSCYIVM
jgi:hypothetical protein